MLKNEYIEKLRECPSWEEECPYYDWRYHKCSMFAEENCEPKDECDSYAFHLENEDEEDEENYFNNL